MISVLRQHVGAGLSWFPAAARTNPSRMKDGSRPQAGHRCSLCPDDPRWFLCGIECPGSTDHSTFCEKITRQQFNWDAGALQLEQRCLVAKGVSELVLAECQDDSFANGSGRRIVCSITRLIGVWMSPVVATSPAHRSGWRASYGGANQSFEWKSSASMLEQLNLKSLIW